MFLASVKIPVASRKYIHMMKRPEHTLPTLPYHQQRCLPPQEGADQVQQRQLQLVAPISLQVL